MHEPSGHHGSCSPGFREHYVGSDVVNDAYPLLLFSGCSDELVELGLACGLDGVWKPSRGLLPADPRGPLRQGMIVVLHRRLPFPLYSDTL